MPHQGWHANISFAGPAAELVCEVMSLWRKLELESNAKNLWLASSLVERRSASPSRDSPGRLSPHDPA
jgi:hypothetical protein